MRQTSLELLARFVNASLASRFYEPLALAFLFRRFR
jgi:hypothetical protein